MSSYASLRGGRSTGVGVQGEGGGKGGLEVSRIVDPWVPRIMDPWVPLLRRLEPARGRL